ncbi:lysosomal enzyme trafficking factor-like [Zootoca vivipara]|uniref:lysosomal enzyme trafficking factor-like n=1 Tax=Zootoca vivipara TaxID=8524 RepID=UPI00159067D9|nr:lysosomal enzyme trafficking factor-like [Zootoca vivipara]XP_060128403.1 lysosomal enzyme trafficking factor-like [Zootoca vivipara]XP_060128406.1 lysosomal enzyme trafficking factor-like [Zootoca vivipara]
MAYSTGSRARKGQAPDEWRKGWTLREAQQERWQGDEGWAGRPPSSWLFIPVVFSSGERFRAWRMMNFRQRMGWIGVGLYLIASAAAIYYVFEINETYNRLALEHCMHTKAHTSDKLSWSLRCYWKEILYFASPEKLREEKTWMHSLKTQLLSLPFWLWTIIFLILYLQIFLFLYSCTRADPQMVGYCIIPICLAVVCNRQQTFPKASNQISRLQLTDT